MKSRHPDPRIHARVKVALDPEADSEALGLNVSCENAVQMVFHRIENESNRVQRAQSSQPGWCDHSPGEHHQCSRARTLPCLGLLL